MIYVVLYFVNVNRIWLILNSSLTNHQIEERICFAMQNAFWVSPLNLLWYCRYKFCIKTLDRYEIYIICESVDFHPLSISGIDYVHKQEVFISK